jgi:ATP-binding cassette subfamily B protein RtxE
MDQGEIKEFGSHQELIKQKGLYYELWVSQVGESEVEKHAK